MLQRNLSIEGVRREAEGDVDHQRRRRRAVKPSRREAAAEAEGLANFLDGVGSLGYLRLFFFSAKIIFSSM
jgi:hypothetical protein